MSPTDILKEVEADLSSLAGLPAEIRAKVKAGAAELTRIRDAIDVTIAALTGSAQSALTSLEAMAAGGAGLVAVIPGPRVEPGDDPGTAQPAAGDPPIDEQPAPAIPGTSPGIG